MYAGIDAPLYAFSLFLPTIINQVSVDNHKTSPGVDTHLVVDWIQCHSRQFTHRPGLYLRLHHDLWGRILWRSQGKTRSAQHVRTLALVWEPGRLKLPSTCFCIGGHSLKWYRSHDITIPRRCWVHHLDLFQESCIIIRCRVSRRMVGVTVTLERRRLIGSPVVFTQQLVSI